MNNEQNQNSDSESFVTTERARALVTLLESAFTIDDLKSLSDRDFKTLRIQLMQWSELCAVELDRRTSPESYPRSKRAEHTPSRD